VTHEQTPVGKEFHARGPATEKALSLVHVMHPTGFVWYQIPAPIRTLFYFKPESVMHVTEMIIYD